MADAESGAEESLEQRRISLQNELAQQRARVVQRLAPRNNDSASAASADPKTANERSALGVSANYPRSMTMRLARQHPSLALGLVALGATLLIRGRGETLESILSMAKSVEPWLRGDGEAD